MWYKRTSTSALPNLLTRLKTRLLSRSADCHTKPVGLHRIRERKMALPIPTSLLLSTLLCLQVASAAKKPHILFLVADDLGYNDVGFTNPDMVTPHLDRLASQGMVLNQSYVQPLCTPSRTAFMTGSFPFKVGTQNGVFLNRQPACIPLNFTFLPQEMKKLGYATHMIGKWHLGFCKWECTPTYRGFDTFFGFYSGEEDHYTHMTDGERPHPPNGNPKYLDLRDNAKVVRNLDGKYSTLTQAERAINIINSHDAAVPLFLYLPFQAPHSPVQVPKQYEDLYPNIKDDKRRQYCGMVSAMDEAVLNITNALKDRGMLEDTLIVFTADNGGAPIAGGNNWPLRGGKSTLWEGGTRAAAFITGYGIQKSGVQYDGLIHAVDWMPTFISAAGGSFEGDIDGIDQWKELSSGQPSKRTEFIYNLADFRGESYGIRSGDYKLLIGNPGNGDWVPPPGSHAALTLNRTLFSKAPRQQPQVQLYNVKDDPTEHKDIAADYPDIVKQLTQRIDFYKQQMVPPIHPADDPASDPNNFGGVWSPGWC